MISGPFAEENRARRSAYETALEPYVYEGEIGASAEYDGEDMYCGTTFDLTLDTPRGEIVMVDLADVLERFDGKRIRLSIEEL